MKKHVLFILCLTWVSLGVCFAQATTPAPKELMKLEDIELQYLNGKKCKLKDFAGKFVLVDMWGQGCKPCVAAIPKLNELQKKYKKKLVILAINDGIYLEKLPAFLKAKEVKYKVVLPKADELMPVYYAFSQGEFHGFPNYTLLGKDGKIIKSDISLKDIESYLNK
jgi:thiol-disulfide isomerase/thioredoxin